MQAKRFAQAATTPWGGGRGLHQSLAYVRRLGGIVLLEVAFVIPGLMPDSSELRALVLALESKSPEYRLRVVGIGWRSNGQPLAYLGAIVDEDKLDDLRIAFSTAWDQVGFHGRPAKSEVILVHTSIADDTYEP